MQSLEHLRNYNGELPKHVLPECYPVYYITIGRHAVCANCANLAIFKQAEEHQVHLWLVEAVINYHRQLQCDRCSQPIKSYFHLSD